MNEYKVRVTYTVTKIFTHEGVIEADSPEQARAIALDGGIDADATDVNGYPMGWGDDGEAEAEILETKEAVQCFHGAAEGNRCVNRFVPKADELFCDDHA